MFYFLTIDEVLNFHDVLISEFGGSFGVRSQELLDSALAQPQSVFAGRFLHEDIFIMASVYAYHIIKNHPFIDGNKRTGIVVALSFLEINGYMVNFSQKDLYQITIDIATSKLSKEKLAHIFKNAVIVKKKTSL